MARVDVDQGEVLTAFVTYIRAALNDDVSFSVNDRTVYETLSANDPPVHWVGTEDSWHILVSPGPGQFDAELFFGGGRRQLMEAWNVVVGIYTRIDLDESGHDHEALLKTGRGILRLKKLVLDAVTGRDLTITGLDAEQSESSTTTAAEEMVFQRELIRPVYATQPQYLVPVAREGEPPGIGCVQMLLGFSVPFDWDLEPHL